MSESYLIPSRTEGIELYVRNKRLRSLERFSSERTVLFVHGARQPPEITFDIELDGLSWMDYMARHGWDAWFVDIRGFAGSTKPREMDVPPEENPPIAPADVALADISTGVAHVRKVRGVNRVSLIGYSRGCDLVGMFGEREPEHIQRGVLCCPFWLDEKPSAPDPDARFGAYQTWNPLTWRVHLQSGAPPSEAEALMPTRWFDEWARLALETDPTGAAQSPPKVRVPAGGMLDRTVWKRGIRLFDPKNVRAPFLVIRGEWDDVTLPSYVDGIFRELASPVKRLVQIGRGTHMMIVETTRMQLFREVQTFLDEASPGDA